MKGRRMLLQFVCLWCMCFVKSNMSQQEASAAPESKGGSLLKWIVGTILTAFVGAAITYHYNQKSENLRAEHEKEAKQEELNKQQEFEREKTDVRHHEAALRRLDKHNADVRTLLRQTHTGYFTVTFENTCSRPLDVVRRYRALDGEAVIEGWRHLGSGESASLIITTAPEFYFYALDDKGGAVQGNLERTITSSQFSYLDDPAFPIDWWDLSQPRRVKFRRVPIKSPSFGRVRYKLQCPSQVSVH